MSPVSQTAYKPVRHHLVTDDDVLLSATLFGHEQGVKSSCVVVINSGAGIPQRYYRKFAAALAGAGIAVVTFDYRGIGGSRGSSALEHSNASVETWGSKDCAAAIRFAAESVPGVPIVILGHSIGTFVAGFLQDAGAVSAIVAVSGHTGYWKDYQAPYRLPMWFMWHCLMPLVTRAFGYFPGRALGFPEDLPARMAFEWAGRRQPEFGWNLRDDRGERDLQRVAELTGRFQAFHVPLLLLRIRDDAFSTEAATARVRGLFVNCTAEIQLLRSSVPSNRVGHFGFFREVNSELWAGVIDWLLNFSRGNGVTL